MNWDSTRIVLNWIRLSTLSAWIYTDFPSMLHTLIFTSTQLWSKFTSLPLPDLSCLSHSCTPGFLRMLTWGQWLSPWRLILQAIVLAVRPQLWNRPSMTAVKKNVGLFGELLLFVFDICNVLNRSQQAFLRLDEELCKAGNGCSIITFNCQWARCPSAVKELFTHYFSFFVCICIVYLILLKTLSDGVEI